MKLGVFKAKVVEITINPSIERPAIITHLQTIEEKPQPLTHVVRINIPESFRIGLDELRAAFPVQLAPLDNEAAMCYLLENSSEFVDEEVTVSVEKQLGAGGVVKVNDKGAPYINVRIRSRTKDMKKADAEQIVKFLLRGVKVAPAAPAINSALEDDQEKIEAAKAAAAAEPAH